MMGQSPEMWLLHSFHPLPPTTNVMLIIPSNNISVDFLDSEAVTKKTQTARRHAGKTFYCKRYEIQSPLSDESSATFYGTV